LQNLAKRKRCSFLLVTAAVLSIVGCGSNVNDPCGLPPSISSLSPNTTAAGGKQFTLTVTGQNFVVTSTLQWNGASRQTSIFSSSQLTAVIPASDIANPGTAKVSISSPTVVPRQVGPCGGNSNSLAFTIN